MPRAARGIGRAAGRRARVPAPRRPASRSCARSPTRRLLRPAWVSRSCRTSGCRRRSKPTADPAHYSGTCGQYAVMLPLRARAADVRAAGGAPWLTASSALCTISSSLRRPAASPRRRVSFGRAALRHQGESRSPRPDRRRGGRHCLCGRTLHHQSGAGRAGHRFPAAPRSTAGASHGRLSSTAAAPMPAPAIRAWPMPIAWRPRSPPPSDAARSTCSWRPRASSASTCRWTRWSSGHSGCRCLRWHAAKAARRPAPS